MVRHLFSAGTHASVYSERGGQAHHNGNDVIANLACSHMLLGQTPLHYGGACQPASNPLSEHQELLRQWIKGCEECLSEIVVRQAQEQRWTPTDFLLFQSNYEALQSTLDSISPHMDSDMQVHVEDIYPCSAMQLKILGSQAVDVGYYQGMCLWKVSLSSSPNVDGSRL